MLPPFHIRNLQPSGQPKAPQNTLVRINAPCYDETISTCPAATLKYHDEGDGDLITLGSSKELTDKLEEPVLPPSSRHSADLQYGTKSSEHHVFEIDDRDYVRKLWNCFLSSSKDAEDIPVAQDGVGDTKWSAERKDKLSVFYERRKEEFWNPIAEELGVTWKSVDAMHWVLGKEEMARRAYELESYSRKFGSCEEIAEKKPESSHNTQGMRQFEEYRVHYFNATRPPQVQLPMPVTPQPLKATAAQATLPRVSSLDQGRLASSIMGKDGEASLTVEGKRQAAGDKLRARTTKGTMSAVDSHKNRWANYKSSTSAFLPNASIRLSQAFDGPGLTSEGKRQAQVAGDKLRCRTNPIRHSKPSRIGTSEHGISKNRWSSYSGTRATRFDERQDAQEEAENTSNTTNTDEVPRDGQPSLLEVFEAELAKKFSATNSEEAPEVEPTLVSKLAFPVRASSESQPLPQGSQAFSGLINEHLQELTATDMALPQDVSTAIDHGIRTVASGLGACIQGIARGLQELSSVSYQAADRTRDADFQFMDDAILGFRNLTGNFTAALGGDLAASRPRTTCAPRSGPGEAETGSSSVTFGASHDLGPGEDAARAQKNNESSLSGGFNPSETAYSSMRNHTAAPRYISDIHASPKVEMERQPRSRPAMSQEPRFHGPGPIHLPNCLGYVDHQSSKIFDEQYNMQRASSPPVQTHFPTLAQFEGENFGTAPSFPALPGMEPLVPQRVQCQPNHRNSEPANGSHSNVSGPNGAEAPQRPHRLVAGHREQSAQLNGHELIPPSRLTSAARLAGPFDPLEAELSARPHLTEGIRRNATIASTGIRDAARRRRPYSEAFDGSGRVTWGAFLQNNARGPRGLFRPSDHRDRPLGATQEHTKRLSRREAGSRRSALAAAGHDDQHPDDFAVGKINDCVEQLRDLGFGGDDEDSAGRLLVYAQVADGVLMDAIDLIDEEQRAYKERL